MGCIHSRRRQEPNVDPPSGTDANIQTESHQENTGMDIDDYTQLQRIDNGRGRNKNIAGLRTSTIVMRTTRLLKAKKYAMVVAIDFGTTHSAYAYAQISENKIDIKLNKNWTSGQSDHYKTPTSLCVAARNSRVIHSFGFEAQNDSASDEDSLKELNLKLFEEFKMQLYDPTRVGSDMTVSAKGDANYTIPSLQVFSMAMGFLKNHCLEHIKETGFNVAEDDIMWVVTVPAIWKDRQKMFMRQAAVQAGLIRNIQGKNLMIALEPEAAAVYCRSIYDENSNAKQISHTWTGSYKLNKGAQFMVVDAGGGTVDITAYRCVENGTCKELITPTGGTCAGKVVNKNFKELLKKILSQKFLEHLSKEYPANLLDLMNAFENCKHKCDSKLSKPLEVPLGYIHTLFENYMGKKLAEHVKEIGVSVNVTNNGKLVVQPEEVQALYASVIDRLIGLVKMTLQKPGMENVTTIFLVGGFSQCKYLESQLKDSIATERPGVTILKPEEPMLCVLRGAVMCGNNPRLIESRVAPVTYLIEAFNHEGLYYSSLVTKGDKVRNGHVEKKYVTPASSAQQNVHLKLFATDKEPPHIPGDPDITEVCDVAIRCSKDDTMCFEFLFGGTEIEITGRNAKTEEEVTTTIDFLHQ